MTDYETIAQAITFISRRAATQPTLADIAAHLHLSPFHFHRLFSRWAGVTPKRFLQVLTLEGAKKRLGESQPLSEVSEAMGLSSPSRLYDHFVRLEAVTPGNFRTGGSGVVIEYGVHPTPFGEAFVGMTGRGVCSLEFLDDGGAEKPLADLAKKWPHAEFRENIPRTGSLMGEIFAGQKNPDRPLSLTVTGTNFQINVWKALLRIPPGEMTSYSRVALAIGHPRSFRAVGGAIGANPVAFLIPCHRVIRQCGDLGDYHWGETRKRAILAWEAAKKKSPSP